MSDGPIKPDDIPRELIEWHLRSHVADSWAEALAERLNKAILPILASEAPNIFGDYVVGEDGISTPNRKV